MKQGYWTVVKRMVSKADVVLEILDARFPNLTRIKRLENLAGKKLILVLNKADIVPEHILEKIKHEYRKRNYILISSKNSKGIHDLLMLIKKSGKGRIKVVVIGYPNTGKSTLINRLSEKGRVGTSSESGFTRGVQFISGKRGIMLIDTPGIIPFEDRDEIRLGLVSGISPSKLKDPDLVAAKLIDIFKKNNPKILEKQYNIKMQDDPYEILSEIGKNRRMLLKKGTIDDRRAAITLLEDWHKGKIML
jgi:ribosome biogenesis GTPase A